MSRALNGESPDDGRLGAYAGKHFLRPRATAAKRSLRKVLRSAGFEVSRAHARAGTLDALTWLIANNGVSIVLDVGANAGEFGDSLRQRGYSGRIASFEPRREAFAQLEERASNDARWTARRVALGGVATDVVINVAANQVSSSILEMERGHVEAAPRAEYVGTEAVRQERLDDLAPDMLDESDVVALKLDVQGYEAAVLEGAAEVLRRTVALHVELSLAPVYKRQPEWRSLVDGLVDRGFVLYALEPVFCNRRTGQTLQVDAVFHRG